MKWHEDGTVTWKGCPFVRYVDLPLAAKAEARARFSPKGRRMGWENIEWWAFAVKKDGTLAKCRYIEPVGPERAS